MLAKAYSATPRGVDALFVTVEVDRIRSQLPSVIVVGLLALLARRAERDARVVIVGDHLVARV